MMRRGKERMEEIPREKKRTSKARENIVEKASVVLLVESVIISAENRSPPLLFFVTRASKLNRLHGFLTLSPLLSIS